MPAPPNEKGILQAMKSMQTITSADASRGGKPSVSNSFPRPPIGFVGSVQTAATPKTKKKNTKKLSAKTPTRPKQTSGANGKSNKDKLQKIHSSPEQTFVPPTPAVKPDTNSQLFGTLVNSLKTGPPVGRVDSIGRPKKGNGFQNKESGKPKKSRTTKTKDKKMRKTKVGYNTSISSSSSSTTSTSPSSSSIALSGSASSVNSSSMSTMTSRSSKSSGDVSDASSGSSNKYSPRAKSGNKVAREKKKRKEELLHEKVEMLTRIINLSKNGFTTTKEWDVKDDIDEIRYECYRMQRESNSKKSIKIMRRVLVTITTLVETGNSYFNPFNLRLDGFSESMMLNLDDYDDCFEQIHHKYSGRSSVGPEMQILFTFMSAAIFHHAGNTIGGGRGGGGTERKKSSVSPMSSVMSMMGMLNRNKSTPVASSFPTPRSTPPPMHANHQSKVPNQPNDGANDTGKPKRKTMRGPGASSMPASIFGVNTNAVQTTPSMTLPSEG